MNKFSGNNLQFHLPNIHVHLLCIQTWTRNYIILRANWNGCLPVKNIFESQPVTIAGCWECFNRLVKWLTEKPTMGKTVLIWVFQRNPILSRNNMCSCLGWFRHLANYNWTAVNLRRIVSRKLIHCYNIYLQSKAEYQTRIDCSYKPGIA